MYKLIAKSNILKISGIILVSSLFLGVLIFSPLFSNVALAGASCTYNGQSYPDGTVYNGYQCSNGSIVPVAPSCPSSSCTFNGQCYANGTVYGNYRCSNGNIVLNTNSGSVSNSGTVTPVAPSCPSSSCTFNGQCYANGTVYGNYQCSNGNIVSLTPSCPSSSCTFNGQCYANGTTYGNYRCSNGSIVLNTTSVSSPNSGSSVSSSNFKPACPFSPQSGRTIVHFEDEVLSGGLRSDVGIDRAQKTKSVYLPAGTYTISMQSFDGGTASDRGDQPNEKYFLQLKNGNTVVAQTNSTVDLPDHVATPVWSGVVNSGLVLSQSVNTVTAFHSVYPNSNPNSLNVGCVAFDISNTPPPPPPPNPQNLSVSCSVNPSSVNIGGYLNWNATASGGNGSYTYSWIGTDGLYGNSSYVSRSYSTTGTKNGTVTVTSGSQSASANCSGYVTGNNSYNNLNVSCYADPSYTAIGGQIRWHVNVSGGDGNYDYDWTGTDGLNSSSRSPAKTYNTSGSKRATVTVQDGNGEEDSATCYANVQFQNSVLAFSQSYQPPMASAVYLSQIPYTGVADNSKLLWFLGILALFSAWIAYIIVSYQKNNMETNS